MLRDEKEAMAVGKVFEDGPSLRFGASRICRQRDSKCAVR